MEHGKLQLGCLLIVLYVGYIYFRENQMYHIKKKEKIFELLWIVGVLNIIFDGLTEYTVNNLQEVPHIVNELLHLFFLCSLDAMSFFMFLYILDVCEGLPRSRKSQILVVMPLVLNLIVVVLFMPQLQYRYGEITNYSMGISAYTCFVMVAIYIMAIIAVLIRNRKTLGRHKLVIITTYVVVAILVTVYQSIHPQALLTCMATTFAIISAYMNIENPAQIKLENYNQEMVMGFATLVEKRDGSTGGHIKRTTEYTRLLAEELCRRGLYRDTLTPDYVKNLVMAASMHDVGKIAIPDAVLQKQARLTEDEFVLMKTHAEQGGRIIQETFGNLGNDEYEKMAYEVSRYHHEKWNGKGYPEGRKGEEIPLCARIVTVADVFDAVSAKRCYRGALPLEECFSIIENGIGTDFDPVIAEAFLGIRDQVGAFCQKNL